MVKIMDIWIDCASCDKQGRNMMLAVDLDNRTGLYLSLDSKINEPLFSDVVKGKCGEPETDGEYVIWENGARLSLDEMFAIVKSSIRPDSVIHDSVIHDTTENKSKVS